MKSSKCLRKVKSLKKVSPKTQSPKRRNPCQNQVNQKKLSLRAVWMPMLKNLDLRCNKWCTKRKRSVLLQLLRSRLNRFCLLRRIKSLKNKTKTFLMMLLMLNRLLRVLNKSLMISWTRWLTRDRWIKKQSRKIKTETMMIILTLNRRLLVSFLPKGHLSNSVPSLWSVVHSELLLLAVFKSVKVLPWLEMFLKLLLLLVLVMEVSSKHFQLWKYWILLLWTSPSSKRSSLRRLQPRKKRGRKRKRSRIRNDEMKRN